MGTRDLMREVSVGTWGWGKHRSALRAWCAASVAHALTRQAPREEDATQREPREKRPWRNRSLALRRSLVSRADA
jgi:hypothetical protein